MNDLAPVHAHLLRSLGARPLPGRSDGQRRPPSASATAPSKSLRWKYPRHGVELGIDVALGNAPAFSPPLLAHYAGASAAVAPASTCPLPWLTGAQSLYLCELLHASCTTGLPGAGRQGAQRRRRHRQGVYDHHPLLHQTTSICLTRCTRRSPVARRGEPRIPTSTGAAEGLGGAAGGGPTACRSACRRRSTSNRSRQARDLQGRDARSKRAAGRRAQCVELIICFPHGPRPSDDGTFVCVMSRYDNEWGFSIAWSIPRWPMGSSVNEAPRPMHAHSTSCSTSTCRWPVELTSTASRRPRYISADKGREDYSAVAFNCGCVAICSNPSPPKRRADR